MAINIMVMDSIEAWWKSQNVQREIKKQREKWDGLPEQWILKISFPVIGRKFKYSILTTRLSYPAFHYSDKVLSPKLIHQCNRDKWSNMEQTELSSCSYEENCLFVLLYQWQRCLDFISISFHLVCLKY